MCPDLCSWPLQSFTSRSECRRQLGVPAFARDRPFKAERKVTMQGAGVRKRKSRSPGKVNGPSPPKQELEQE